MENIQIERERKRLHQEIQIHHNHGNLFDCQSVFECLIVYLHNEYHYQRLRDIFKGSKYYLNDINNLLCIDKKKTTYFVKHQSIQNTNNLSIANSNSVPNYYLHPLI